MNTTMMAKCAKASRFLAATVAAVAASTTLAYETVTTNGVTWKYVTNADGANTVTLGPGTGSGTSCTDEDRAIPVETSVSASLIPWVFEKDGVTYTVTEVNNHAFYGCMSMTGTLTIPDAVKVVRERAFNNCQNVSKLASLGGVTTISGNYAFGGMIGCKDYFPDLSNVTAFDTGVFENWTGLSGDINVVLNPSLTTIPGRMFYKAKITGVKVPRSVASVGFYSFASTRLSGLLIPGPLTAASASQYTSISAIHLLLGTSTVKVFFAGPNTKADLGSTYANDMLGGSTDCKAFVPANGLWDGITDATAGGTNTKVIKYGPGEEIDFALDTEEKVITAKPTTEAAFTNVLNWATLFKDKLGYDTRVSVTNSIEVSADAVTPEMLANVQLNSTLMMFAVKTQAQLDSVLAAVPQTTMLAIDPTGAREELTMPQDRALWVWLSGTGKYTPYFSGFRIIYR